MILAEKSFHDDTLDYVYNENLSIDPVEAGPGVI